MYLFKNTIVSAHKLRVQAANLRRSLQFDLLQHVINPVADKLRPFGVTDFVKNRLGHGKPEQWKTAPARDSRSVHRFSFPTRPTNR